MSHFGNLGFLNRSNTLRGRVQIGGAFTVGGFGLSQFLRLLSNLILTRLLMPEAFGLIAAAVSVTVLAIMLTDIGIHNCIVRSENAEKSEFLQTAWTVQILRNFVVWAIVMVLTGLVSAASALGYFPPDSTFADERLPLVLTLTALQLIISGFNSSNVSIATRNLLVGRTFIRTIAAQLAGAVTTIAGAYAGMGVWALVLGINISALVSLALSFIMFPGPPMRIRWDRSFVSEILNFGKWLAISSLFGFMTNKGDHMIFGWAFDKEQFGLYAISTIWIGVAVAFLEAINSRVLYPALSEVMRDRPANLARAYRRSRLVLDGLAVSMVVGIYFGADFIFGFLYPGAFSGVAYYLKLLTPMVLLSPYWLMSSLVLSMGETKRYTLVSFVRGLATLVITPAVIMVWGEKAGVIAFACVGATSVPVLWWIVQKKMSIDWPAELRMLIAAAVLAVFLIGAPPLGV